MGSSGAECDRRTGRDMNTELKEGGTEEGRRGLGWGRREGREERGREGRGMGDGESTIRVSIDMERLAG